MNELDHETRTVTFQMESDMVGEQNLDMFECVDNVFSNKLGLTHFGLAKTCAK